MSERSECGCYTVQQCTLSASDHPLRSANGEKTASCVLLWRRSFRLQRVSVYFTTPRVILRPMQPHSSQTHPFSCRSRLRCNDVYFPLPLYPLSPLCSLKHSLLTARMRATVFSWSAYVDLHLIICTIIARLSWHYNVVCVM